MPIIQYIGAGCFWIFSSESLVLAGNGAGYGMMQMGLVVFLFAAGIFSGTIAFDKGQKHEETAKTVFGGPTGVILIITGFSGIIGTCLFVSTGILVSAGFTFNEVFFYRFPNFGFAFMLLVSAVALSFLSERKKELLTGVLVSGAAGCILLLVLLAVGSLPHSGAVKMAYGTNSSVFWPLLFLFLGYERIIAHAGNRLKPPNILLCMAAGLAVLVAWGYVSSVLVASDKLAESTIPHMLAAGKIAPPWGRYLMGAAVISSGLAVVLRFLSLSDEFLVSSGLLPPVYRFRILVGLLLAGVIICLMFTGVAGNERLETLIRTSLLLWMVYGGTMVLKQGMAVRKSGKIRYSVYISAGVFLAGCLAVFLFQGEYALNSTYLALFLAGSALCVVLLKAIRRLLYQKT